MIITLEGLTMFCLLQFDYHHPSSITIHEALVLVLSYLHFSSYSYSSIVCPSLPSSTIMFHYIHHQLEHDNQHDAAATVNNS
jgi:hypothetical protein